MIGYRVVTSQDAFECSGRFERVEETFLLRLEVRRPEALAMERDIRKERPIEVVAIAAGVPVLAARIHKIKARDNGPFIEVACLLAG